MDVYQTCVRINVHTQHSAACIQTYVMTNVHTQQRAAKTKLNLSGLDSVSVHLILSWNFELWKKENSFFYAQSSPVAINHYQGELMLCVSRFGLAVKH